LNRAWQQALNSSNTAGYKKFILSLAGSFTHLPPKIVCAGYAVPLPFSFVATIRILAMENHS
jgi:hypothetical protein